MYQVFPGIVIVLSAMFNLQLWSELEGKRCRYCYDYDKENFIQNLSFKCTCVPNASMYLPKYYFPQVLPTNFGQTKHVSFSTKQATQPRKIFVEELWSATLLQQGKRQQLLPSRSAQFGSAWAGNKNQNKFHEQPCHFHCFL